MTSSKPLAMHPQARNEASEAYLWYRDRDPRVADRFDEELGRYLELIEQRPLIFQSYLLETRRCVMKNFPYQIVIQETSTDWFVVAVAHCRRMPGYWSARLK